MERREFYEKDGILITYTDSDVCFEDCATAESVLLKNNGEILHSNFPPEKTAYFQDCLKQIYAGITALRNLDALESA